MPRAVSPVVGVVTLVGLTVLLSATLLASATVDVADPGPTAALAVSADADADRIVLSHEGGDDVDVTEMDLHVAVDGEPLRHQPPVPFFAARGFESGPEGAFNTASENLLRAGEETSLAVAATNSPAIRHGATVRVRVTVRETTVYDGETTAR